MCWQTNHLGRSIYSTSACLVEGNKMGQGRMDRNEMRWRSWLSYQFFFTPFNLTSKKSNPITIWLSSISGLCSVEKQILVPWLTPDGYGENFLTFEKYDSGVWLWDMTSIVHINLILVAHYKYMCGQKPFYTWQDFHLHCLSYVLSYQIPTSAGHLW